MALTDWSKIFNPGSQGATQQEVDTGNFSYSLGTDGGVISDQTMNDAPSEFKIKTRFHLSSGDVLGFYFWLQELGKHINYEYADSSGTIYMYEAGGGPSSSASTASVADGTWKTVELTVWENGGILNSRLVIDGSQIGRDLSLDKSNLGGPAPGGIGFQAVVNNNPLYLDETEIFY